MREGGRGRKRIGERKGEEEKERRGRKRKRERMERKKGWIKELGTARHKL